MADINWQELFIKFARRVVDDDHIVGLRCLNNFGEWTPEESEVLKPIQKLLWNEQDLASPWREEFFYEP